MILILIISLRQVLILFFVVSYVFLTAVWPRYDHSLRTKRSFTGVTGQQNPVRLYIIILKLSKYEVLYQKLKDT